MNFSDSVLRDIMYRLAYEKERLIANATMDGLAEIIIASKVVYDLDNGLVEIVVKPVHNRKEIEKFSGDIEMYRLIN